MQGGRRIITAQAASLDPVDTVAKLGIQPTDFPLRIHGFDLAATLARIDADPDGFPWLTDDET